MRTLISTAQTMALMVIQKSTTNTTSTKSPPMNKPDDRDKTRVFPSPTFSVRSRLHHTLKNAQPFRNQRRCHQSDLATNTRTTAGICPHLNPRPLLCLHLPCLPHKILITTSLASPILIANPINDHWSRSMKTALQSIHTRHPTPRTTLSPKRLGRHEDPVQPTTIPSSLDMIHTLSLSLPLTTPRSSLFETETEHSRPRLFAETLA